MLTDAALLELSVGAGGRLLRFIRNDQIELIAGNYSNSMQSM